VIAKRQADTPPATPAPATDGDVAMTIDSQETQPAAISPAAQDAAKKENEIDAMQAALDRLRGVPGCHAEAAAIEKRLKQAKASKPSLPARQVYAAAEVELETATARRDAAARRVKEAEETLERQRAKLREAEEEREIAQATLAAALAELQRGAPGASGDSDGGSASAAGASSPLGSCTSSGPDVARLHEIYKLVEGGPELLTTHYKDAYAEHVAKTTADGGTPLQGMEWLWRQLAQSIGSALAVTPAGSDAGREENKRPRKE